MTRYVIEGHIINDLPDDTLNLYPFHSRIGKHVPRESSSFNSAYCLNNILTLPPPLLREYTHQMLVYHLLRNQCLLTV